MCVVYLCDVCLLYIYICVKFEGCVTAWCLFVVCRCNICVHAVYLCKVCVYVCTNTSVWCLSKIFPFALFVWWIHVDIYICNDYTFYFITIHYPFLLYVFSQCTCIHVLCAVSMFEWFICMLFMCCISLNMLNDGGMISIFHLVFCCMWTVPKFGRQTALFN